MFLSWQTSKGHALIDRTLYLPQEWTDDPERRRTADMPEDVSFASKPALARRLVERVLVTGAVHGADYKLRAALEEAA